MVIEETAKFCQYCGEQLVSAAPQVQVLPKETPEEIPASATKADRPPKQVLPAGRREYPEPPEAPAPSAPVPELKPEPEPEPPAEPGPGPEREPVSPAEVPPARETSKKPRKSRAAAKYVAAAVAVVAVAGILVLVALPALSGAGLKIPLAAFPTPTPVPTTAEPTPVGTVTVVPTTAPPTPTPTPTPALKPEPTQDLPKGIDIYIYVDRKNPDDATVPVRYDGGPGRNAIANITAMIVRSDGAIEYRYLDLKTVPSEVLLPGTRGTDRVEVFVTVFGIGKTYKIIDQQVSFR
jgi:hypothetical protein